MLVSCRPRRCSCRAINRRAEQRIRTLRQVGGDIVETGTPREARIERVFALNMGICEIKYSMNLVMNLMLSYGRPGIGCRRLVCCRGRRGAGLGKLNDPWGDLVNWARELSVDSVKYRLFADAVGQRGLATA